MEPLYADHGLAPTDYTYYLVVRMLVRYKQLPKALEVIRSMPSKGAHTPSLSTDNLYNSHYIPDPSKLTPPVNLPCFGPQAWCRAGTQSGC